MRTRWWRRRRRTRRGLRWIRRWRGTWSAQEEGESCAWAWWSWRRAEGKGEGRPVVVLLVGPISIAAGRRRKNHFITGVLFGGISGKVTDANHSFVDIARSIIIRFRSALELRHRKLPVTSHCGIAPGATHPQLT